MEKKEFKLNYKNTFKIAFAFFGILMLWSVYNTYCPIILEAMLGENHDYLVGIIMALDNVIALLIMPLFGKLSDNTNTKFGKRMPYIIIGMALTAVIFPFIALACKWNSIGGVIVAMLLFLIIMQAYRSPAVALMPDITPKPIRSKANGIINLVGYIGGVFATVLGMLPLFKMSSGSSLDDVQTKVLLPFLVCTAVYVIVLIYLIFAVKENKLLEETKDDVEAGEKEAEVEEKIGEDNKLSKSDKRNFMIILAAVFLWFMSFNAFETFGSLYFKNVVGDSTMYALMSTVLSVVSIASFVAFSGVSNKIGRKWTVLTGLFSMVVALGLIAVISIVVKPATVERVTDGVTYEVQKDGCYLACITNNDDVLLFTTTELRKDSSTGKNETYTIKLNGKEVEAYNVKQEGSEYKYELWFYTEGAVKDAKKEDKKAELKIELAGKSLTMYHDRYVGAFLDNAKNVDKLMGQEKVRFIWKVFFILMSAVMGFGWALININSFPMVVEYSNSKNLGKFTGYYYIASMLAQSITPIIIGVIMDKSVLGQRLLFVYSGILMVIATVVFFLIKEKFTVKERLEKYGSSDKGVLGNLGSMDD